MRDLTHHWVALSGFEQRKRQLRGEKRVKRNMKGSQKSASGVGSRAATTTTGAERRERHAAHGDEKSLTRGGCRTYHGDALGHATLAALKVKWKRGLLAMRSVAQVLEGSDLV